ncbi:MAG: DnaK suppressor protein [candidate division TM6 bacterium GW2011_GWF2_37_49]|nr:MAG: DnaK suppressor protein [candidate division TM6 bacterium GW2011_GWF2_37_49]
MKDRAIFIEKMKASMLVRRSEMLGLMTQLASEKVSDGQVQDSGDEALSISMEHLQSSLQQTDMDEIRLIDGALERIVRQEYGVCIDCANPIPEKRLENFPYAARCVACQEKLEL